MFKQIPNDLLKIISEYVGPAFHPWFEPKSVMTDQGRCLLSTNPHPAVMEYLMANPHLIHPYSISQNPSAIQLLTMHPRHIVWASLLTNKNALEMPQVLTANRDDVFWINIMTNPAAGDLILENFPCIVYWLLVENRSLDNILFKATPNQRQIMTKKILWEISNNNIYRNRLLSNPGAIEFITKYADDLLDWTVISINPAAIPLLEKNLDKISWSFLHANPAGLPLLLANPQKINWRSLTSNNNPLVIKLFQEKFLTVKNLCHMLECEEDIVEDFYGNPGIIMYTREELLEFLKLL